MRVRAYISTIYNQQREYPTLQGQDVKRVPAGGDALKPHCNRCLAGPEPGRTTLVASASGCSPGHSNPLASPSRARYRDAGRETSYAPTDTTGQRSRSHASPPLQAASRLRPGRRTGLRRAVPPASNRRPRSHRRVGGGPAQSPRPRTRLGVSVTSRFAVSRAKPASTTPSRNAARPGTGGLSA